MNFATGKTDLYSHRHAPCPSAVIVSPCLDSIEKRMIPWVPSSITYSCVRYHALPIQHKRMGGNMVNKIPFTIPPNFLNDLNMKGPYSHITDK
jgi:hypothetical protein